MTLLADGWTRATHLGELCSSRCGKKSLILLVFWRFRLAYPSAAQT